MDSGHVGLCLPQEWGWGVEEIKGRVLAGPVSLPHLAGVWELY